MTKKETFAAALTIVASAFGRELPALAIEGYWLALTDLDENKLKWGVSRALREWTGRFMPTPPEFRELCLGKNTRDQRALNAANAWEVVRAAMDKYDYTRSVDFGPLTNAVVRNMGGWIWLCERNGNDLTFDRKRFEEVHMSLSLSQLSAARAAPLPGAFGGKPVLFHIPGEPSRRLALSEDEPDSSQIVRQLADKKGVG